MNKRWRQAKIREIIKKESVGTQDELVRKLREKGITATQATISRDIRELGLVKVRSEDGRYRYAVPQEARDFPVGIRILREEVLTLDSAENLLLVKTSRGSAPRVGEILDTLDWPEIVGTVAGDDTVLVVIRERKLVQEVINRLYQLMG